MSLTGKDRTLAALFRQGLASQTTASPPVCPLSVCPPLPAALHLAPGLVCLSNLLCNLPLDLGRKDPWPGHFTSVVLNIKYAHKICIKKSWAGTCLVVQWIRLHLPVREMWVQFLVRELRFHTPCGQKTKTEQKQYCNRVNKDFKNGPYKKKILKSWASRPLSTWYSVMASCEP